MHASLLIKVMAEAEQALALLTPPTHVAALAKQTGARAAQAAPPKPPPVGASVPGARTVQ